EHAVARAQSPVGLGARNHRHRDRLWRDDGFHGDPDFMSDTDNTAPNLAAVVGEAHALVERRRYAHARVTIAHGLRHFPDNAELLYLAAFVDYATNDRDAAMQTVMRVLATAPEHYGARRLCAHLHEAK